MAKWLTTERMTIDRARELLANRIGDLPIYLRWYRCDTSQAWAPKYPVTVTLHGVTAKRLKVKEIGGGYFFVDPNKLFAATRVEV